MGMLDANDSPFFVLERTLDQRILQADARCPLTQKRSPVPIQAVCVSQVLEHGSTVKNNTRGPRFIATSQIAPFSHSLSLLQPRTTAPVS